MGVDVDPGPAVGDVCVRSGRVELGVPAERSAADLLAPDDALLLAQGRAVPALDEHPDPARDDVGPAAEPRLRLVVADPHEALHLARVVDVEVARAVLEAHEVARRDLVARRLRVAAEAELHPAHLDQPAPDAQQVAHGVEGDLRVVGAGLDAQVAAAAGGIELVAGQRPERPQARGRLRDAAPCGPPRPSRTRRADADGDRQPRRPAARRPRRCRRADLGLRRRRRPSAARRSSAAPPPSTCAAAPAGRARRRRRGRRRAKTSRACAGVATPAWWTPWKGTVSRGGAARRPRRRSRRPRSPRRRRPRARRPRRRRAAPAGASARAGSSHRPRVIAAWSAPSRRRATAARPAPRPAGRTAGGPAA